MSNIHDLPLMSLRLDLAPVDDLLFGLMFTDTSGLYSGAELDLGGIVFTFEIEGVARLTSPSLSVFGGALIVFVAAADRTAWPTAGCAALRLSAGDGVFSRALIYHSIVKFRPDPAPTFLAARPARGRVRLMGLDDLDDYLVSVLLSQLPNLQLGADDPGPGYFMVNSSGFVVMSIDPSAPTAPAAGALGSVQALLAMLPNLYAGGAIPGPGRFFVNDSAFVALALNGDGPPTAAVQETSFIAQGLLARLVNVANGDAVPQSRQFMVDSSGFVGISQ